MAIIKSTILWKSGRKILVAGLFAALSILKCNPATLDTLISGTNSTYSIGGIVTGLNTGGVLVLQNNGGDDLNVVGTGASTLSFVFNAELSQGETYYITVLNQPASQICVVGAGLGTVVSSDITNILVTCGTDGTYTVGGSVTGLVGTGLVLSNNGTDYLPISADGPFNFGVSLADLSAYSVTVSTPPSGPNQFCSVTNGSGSIAGSNISNITIICTTNSYSISGSVSGLASSEQVVLRNNGGNDTLITGAGGGSDPFTFSTQINDGQTYNVTILSKPALKNCSVTNGTGTVSGGPVTTVSVSCIPAGTYSVGGTLSGLGSGATLAIKLATGENLILTANGAYTFSTAHPDAAAYTVSVVQNPVFPSQVCNITNPGGTIATASVTNVNVACTTNTFTVSANITGLTALGGQITIENNNAETTVINADGVHTFAAQNDATIYDVKITAQSAQVNCGIVGSKGILSGANVMASITCNPFSTYTVAVQVAGANITGGTGLKVQLNGTELSPSIMTNTTYTFSTLMHLNDPYSVAVTQSPNRANGNSVNQTCVATMASGTISANVTVNVNCSTNNYTVGGVINGLAGGETIILLNNGVLVVLKEGAGTGTDNYAFSPQMDGSSFAISILYKPSTKNCTMGGTPGAIAGANITTVTVTCSNAVPYSIGGTVTGLLGTGLVLQNNGGNDLTINSNGGFTFSTPLYTGNSYSATILTQPGSPTQTCSVSNASGTIAAANITNILVSCVITTYSVSGTITGLTAGDQVTLTNNGSDFTSLTSAGGTDNFFFSTPLVNGQNYNVWKDFSIPSNIQCTSSSGTVAGANVVLNITCQPTYFIGGTETGLASGKNVTLINNGSDWLTVFGTGAPVNFQFSNPLTNGSSYNVVVSSIPPDYDSCNLTNATGTVSGAHVSNITVTCIPKCGNTVLNPGETCDDGNVASGDGCSSTCQTESPYVNPTNFESAPAPSLEGWTMTGLWHFSSVRSWTPSFSARFADPVTNNFSTGSTVTGALTSPTVLIGGTGQMSFYYFHNGECGNGTTCTYDKLSVEVSTDGGTGWDFIQNLVDAEAGMTYQNINLAAYTGQNVMVRFYFNSVDSAGNTYEGSYVDNITFY